MTLAKWTRARRCAILVGALLASMALSAARGAGPDVLNYVPSDACGVVVINNVRTFANKLSNAATRLKMDLPSNPVGWALGHVGITQSFDANSSAALVLLKPDPEGASGGYLKRMLEGSFTDLPPMVILIPTTSSKDMMVNFKPGEPDNDGMSQISLPAMPDVKAYMAVVEKKWVAIAEKKGDLQSYLQRKSSFAKSAPPHTLSVFDNNDVVAWGDVEKLGVGMDKWLSDHQILVGGMLELTNQIQKADPLQAAMQRQIVNSGFALATEFFKDVGAGMVTLRLTDSGATFGLVSDFKPESPMGKFVLSQAPGDHVATLQGLPAGGGNFLMAATMKINGKTAAPIFMNFMNQVLSEPAVAKEPRTADTRRLMELIRPLLETLQGESLVLLDPAAGGEGKNGLLNGAALVDVTDPQKFLDSYLQMARSAVAQQGIDPDYKQALVLSPDAVTVKDVRLTKFNMKISLREETPANPIAPEKKQAFEMIQRLYGPEGITAYIGVVGRRVLMIIGSDNVTIESSVAAAQANSDELSQTPMIAATKDQIVEHPAMVFYLPITRWMTLAQSMLAPGAAAAGGAGAGGGAGGNAPPVVMSAGISGSTVTTEVHVPIATIMALQDAVMHMAPGGGAGGGARGGGEAPLRP